MTSESFAALMDATRRLEELARDFGFRAPFVDEPLPDYERAFSQFIESEATK